LVAKQSDILQERIARLEALLGNGLKNDIQEIKDSIENINKRLDCYLERITKLESEQKIIQWVFIGGMILAVIGGIVAKLIL
jgi:molecular chaperone GrpE (heat shock protein)